MKPFKIGCLGEAMIELIANRRCTHAQLGVAGDSMNTAIYLKRCLGPAHEVSFISMVGTDPLSDRIEEFIASEDVLTNLLKRHPQKLPGFYSIATDGDGERSFSYWRDSSAARDVFSSPLGLAFEALDDFDVVFASAISLAIFPQSVRDSFFDWIETFRSKGGRFVFDSNYRPALWLNQDLARSEISRAWKCCDIALPSIDDELLLFGDDGVEAVLRRFGDYGITVGALKCGALGPIQISDMERRPRYFIPAEKVVDTTAAGDSFNGAFLATYLTTGDATIAVATGHKLARQVVGCRGAIIPKLQLT